MLAKNLRYKYRGNRKNNKINEIQDVEKEDAKKGPEMWWNVEHHTDSALRNMGTNMSSSISIV